MRKTVARRMADHVANWHHRGLIDDDLAVRLNRRYSIDVTMRWVLLRWLGFLAVFMLGISLLGLIGLALGSVAAYIAPFALGALAYFMWLKGTQLASHPTQRYATSGAVLITAGLIAAFAAQLMLYTVLGGSRMQYAVPTMMIIVAAAALFTAYRFSLRWPLALGVLLVFHALGNTHEYIGHGGYFFGIADQRLTLSVALATVALGLWHEKTLEQHFGRREIGFGQIYIVLGLAYANVCLWLLSIADGDLTAVLMFSAACVAQIVLGARLHDGRFTGFGVVFLAIDIYTRLFEGFWDDISKGSFFLLCGAIAMGAGAALEYRARKLTVGTMT